MALLIGYALIPSNNFEPGTGERSVLHNKKYLKYGGQASEQITRINDYGCERIGRR